MTFAGLPIQDIVRAPIFLVLYLVLLLLAKWFKGLAISYKINQQLSESGNLAIGLAMSGYYLATALILVGALYGPSHGLLQDLLAVGGYSLAGIVLLNLSRWFNDWAILRKFDDTHQLIARRNVGVGAVHFGAYVATGLVIAGSVSGEGGGIVSMLVFFVLGQLSLLAFSLIYERLSPYSIHKTLVDSNVASGVAFAGHLIALAIIIMNASAGDFVNWPADLMAFFAADLIAFVFLPILRLIMDRMVIPGRSLGREIRDNGNLAAALLEATTAICFAGVTAMLI
ncbi:DUF350 domain-containing protein [Devosia sp. LjRoot16]|uniref:DUF350 domain-containing protein n=1 Tax=Devosia sp. LjRoot16 TaxID=3342271 RepID=UPI003ECEA81C